MNKNAQEKDVGLPFDWVVENHADSTPSQDEACNAVIFEKESVRYKNNSNTRRSINSDDSSTEAQNPSISIFRKECEEPTLSPTQESSSSSSPTLESPQKTDNLVKKVESNVDILLHSSPDLTEVKSCPGRLFQPETRNHKQLISPLKENFGFKLQAKAAKNGKTFPIDSPPTVSKQVSDNQDKSSSPTSGLNDILEGFELIEENNHSRMGCESQKRRGSLPMPATSSSLEDNFQDLSVLHQMMCLGCSSLIAGSSFVLCEACDETMATPLLASQQNVPLTAIKSSTDEKSHHFVKRKVERPRSVNITEYWVCQQCTLQNPLNSHRCQVCHWDKYKEVKVRINLAAMTYGHRTLVIMFSCCYYLLSCRHPMLGFVENGRVRNVHSRILLSPRFVKCVNRLAAATLSLRMAPAKISAISVLCVSLLW